MFFMGKTRLQSVANSPPVVSLLMLVDGGLQAHLQGEEISGTSVRESIYMGMDAIRVLESGSSPFGPQITLTIRY